MKQRKFKFSTVLRIINTIPEERCGLYLVPAPTEAASPSMAVGSKYSYVVLGDVMAMMRSMQYHRPSFLQIAIE